MGTRSHDLNDTSWENIKKVENTDGGYYLFGDITSYPGIIKGYMTVRTDKERGAAYFTIEYYPEIKKCFFSNTTHGKYKKSTQELHSLHDYDY